MLVANGDAGVVEANDAVAGDRDAEHIACQILQYRIGAIAPGGAMGDPGLVPDRRRYDKVWTPFCERGLELATDQIGQGLGRYQIV